MYMTALMCEKATSCFGKTVSTCRQYAVYDFKLYGRCYAMPRTKSISSALNYAGNSPQYTIRN